MTAWPRRVATGVALALAVLLAPAPPAQAHPFGDPQTVTVSGSGDTVVLVWRVGAADDLTLLGVELGVLPEDRVLLDGAITYDDGDAAAVAGSEALRAYVGERITVATDGRPCPGEVTEVGDLVDEGARIEFACDGPVTAVDVTVRTLTELHPAYRALVTGPSGQRAAYGRSADTHRFTLDPAAAADGAAAPPAAHGDDLGRSAALQLSAVLGAILLAVVVAAVVLRRRGRRQPTTPQKETPRVRTTASPSA